jgi:hypothetical protein
MCSSGLEEHSGGVYKLIVANKYIGRMKAQGRILLVGISVIVIVFGIVGVIHFQSESPSISRRVAIDSTKPQASVVVQLLSGSKEQASEAEEANAFEPSFPTESLIALEPEPYNAFQLMEQHMEAARAGNARSQYLVSRLLSECVGSPSSMEQIDRLRQNEAFAGDIVSDLEVSLERCKPFHERYGDLRTQRETWLESAAANGSHVAILEKHLLNSIAEDEYSKEAFQAKLIPALVEASESEHVLDQAIFGVQVYFSNFAEWRSLERAAWTIVYCQSSLVCDLDKVHADEIELVFKSHEIESIRALADDYAKAIIEKNWEELDLTHP